MTNLKNVSVPDYDKDRNEKFTNILSVRGSMVVVEVHSIQLILLTLVIVSYVINSFQMWSVISPILINVFNVHDFACFKCIPNWCNFIGSIY